MERTPINKGNWLWDGGEKIAKARSDEYTLVGQESEPMVDLIIYDRDGERIGRESPAMGGPRGYEPCCGALHWKRIQRPDFPLPRMYALHEVLDLHA